MIITAVVCSLVFFTLGMLVGVLCLHCATVVRVRKSKNSSPTPPATSIAVVYEEVSPDTNTGTKSDIELKDNVAYGPI